MRALDLQEIPETLEALKMTLKTLRTAEHGSLYEYTVYNLHIDRKIERKIDRKKESKQARKKESEKERKKERKKEERKTERKKERKNGR